MADRTVVGIIPARAGFTHLHEADDQPVQDHPRSRGVYAIVCAVLSSLYGSSPLARGLQQRRRRRVTGSGIIPARAGFTAKQRARDAYKRDHPRSRGVYRRAPRPSRSLSDHPRSRGVYASRCPKGRPSTGSSPLARGLLDHVADGRGRVGIIPARAGFTRSSAARKPWMTDHPRSRGVYYEREGKKPEEPGSSPLARGLPNTKPPLRRRPRIIPARAGFTRILWMMSRWSRDHPRSRGVYLDLRERDGTRPGSSPLARGLQLVGTVWCAGMRIIPARAGFTSHSYARRPRRRDHPRSRGVYGGESGPGGSRKGSSPLARGLRRTPCRGRHPARIIPARAGFTCHETGRDANEADHPRSRGVYHW